MSVFEILTDGASVLRRKCKPVEKVDRKVRDILDRMLETMYAAPGVGLAAPQIGISRRMIVMDVGNGPIKLVNPKVTFLSDEEELGMEGCLSFPGLEGEVWRCTKVRLSGLDENGEKVSYEGEGLFARCAQHECDHLDGRVYVDLAENLHKVSVTDESDSNNEAEGSSAEAELAESADAVGEANKDGKSDTETKA
ncbi:MAG: peptide deformylase [Candidatus Bruticola sp.]